MPKVNSSEDGLRTCQDCGFVADPAKGEIRPKGKFCAECIRKHRNDYHRAYHPGYYERNRERILERLRTYRVEHREEILVKQHEWTMAHAEEVRAKSRRWYYANKERHQERVAAWKAAHPGKQQEYQRIHYARKKLNHKEWAEYLEESRMRARLKAELDGKPFAPVSLTEYRKRYGNGGGHAHIVPAENIRPFVLAALRVETEAELARRSGVSDKRVREIAAGVERISIVTADHLCVALGLTLSLVYPEAA